MEQEIGRKGGRLQEFEHLLRSQHRFAGDVVERSLRNFGPVWHDRFDAALAAMFPTDQDLANAVRGYARFAMTSLRLQARYVSSGQYEAKTYAEAAEQVYHNPEYMVSEYLPGLFLSHYLWPHHYRQIQFFECAFLDPIRNGQGAGFVEVGIGTGIYSRMALAALEGAHGVGIDISPTSLSFASRQMKAFGVGERFFAREENVTTDTASASADNLICVEVLEHLEDPEEFLRALRRVLKPGGRAFITAALSAAHTDHIYLYTDPAEVEVQLINYGFQPEQWFVGQAYDPPRPGEPVPKAVAFVVH